MAAASNKPGFVHYSLIVFVMATVILGITTYMNHREYSDRLAAIDKLEKDLANEKKIRNNKDEEVQALSKNVGNQYEVVLDHANPANANSVVGSMKTDFDKFAKDFAGTNYAQTLQKLREAIDKLEADVGLKNAANDTLKKQMTEQATRLNTQVDTHRKAQEKAEADLRNLTAKRDEMLNAKQTEIDRLKGDVNQLTADLSAEKEAREKERKKLSDDIAQLEKRIDILSDRNNVLSGVRFEQADGTIASVNTSSKTVVIGLGEADQLKKGMTFSVYPKDNRALGAELDELKDNIDDAYSKQKINMTERDDRKRVLDFTGLKGKIAVTRLLGPHSAECRIIEEDLYRPMIRGDVIYTPTWSPGLVEKVSIIGDIDLDNDGKSDREQLRQFLAISGVVIDNEVDDAGERLPEGGKLSIQTKFLVLGNIPDAADLVNQNEKDRVAKINAHLTAMRDEARKNGVRVVKLNDFLAHVGFEAKRRMFRPGDDRPYALQDGNLKPQVNAPLGDVSNAKDVFRPKATPQAQSSGTTSKVFGSNK